MRENDFIIGDDGKCIAVFKNGERCKSNHLPGVTVCKRHGGSLPQVAAKSKIIETSRDMRQRKIEMIPETDPEARGDVSLQYEIRRTVGWIRYCEDQINALGGPDRVSADDLDDIDHLGAALGGIALIASESVVGHERGESTELHTERWSVGVNVWEEKLRWNRAHLVVLTKQWIAAGFEAKRLELAQRTLDDLEKVLDGVIRDLGHNPRDPEIRRIIRDRLNEIDGE